MSPVPKDIGLLVGLEIHQQLDTKRKLFCRCAPQESDEYDTEFVRILRAARSEMGAYDPAALFEGAKSRLMVYRANRESSCLVEADEEPPHDADAEATRTALIVASALNSEIITEMYPMRKIVVDGSNTSGFQRTILAARGGALDAGDMRVGVQSICLEEDAARLLGDADGRRIYGLDRLGIPLVEIALEPVAGGGAEARRVALALGRILRATRRVRRGLGSIRQDVNVSITGGGVVEVKGVQQLDQLEKVVEYEARRQHGMRLLAERIAERGDAAGETAVYDVADIMASCDSGIISGALGSGADVRAVRVRGFAGLFGWEPYEGIRLGRELGGMVKYFGVGGILHSDELPAYGIDVGTMESVQKRIGAENDDAFLIIAAAQEKIDYVVDSVIRRITDARNGAPAETRLALANGQTRFLRPRPGPSRMYPETDIRPITISDDMIAEAKVLVPVPWDESVAGISRKYGINRQLAEQVFDSRYASLFERICKERDVAPAFVASCLCSTITSLERDGLDSGRLDDAAISEVFSLLSRNRITKESVGMIFEEIMSGRAGTVEDAVAAGGGPASDEEIRRAVQEVLDGSLDFVRERGDAASGPLMGRIMKSMRGRADGSRISRILGETIRDVLDKK